MTELALRPRSATEILDLAVRLLRRHFRAFFTLGLVGAVPVLAVQLLFLALGASNPASGSFSTMLTGVGVLALVVGIVSRSLMVAALLVGADDGLRTGVVDVGSALRRGVARLGPVIGVSLLTTFATMIGFLLLIVPGIYLALRLATVVPPVAVEGEGVFAAIRRTWDRSEGHLGHTFKVLALLTLLYIGFLIAVGSATGVAALMAGASGSLGTAGVGTFFVLMQAVTAVVTAAIYPLLTNALLALTYDLRVRREAYDIEVMAASLGAAP